MANIIFNAFALASVAYGILILIVSAFLKSEHEKSYREDGK